jgi:hypothetical protein
MVARSIITRMISDDITENQVSDTYEFDSGTISWVAGQESFCLTQGRKTYWATPSNIQDLIDRLELDDLQEWFDNEFEGYSPMDILDAILEVVGTELEAAE